MTNAFETYKKILDENNENDFSDGKGFDYFEACEVFIDESLIDIVTRLVCKKYDNVTAGRFLETYCKVHKNIHGEEFTVN